jgi:hypothetical protein
MPLISVTRLHLRSARYFPPFLFHIFRSARQVRGAPGFLGGMLAGEGAFGFWTITAWHDERSMREYRNTRPHMRAMPKLLGWCDEATVVHWGQPDASLPDMAEALRRMVDEGKISKVNHPSEAHRARQIAPARKLPRAALPLKPSSGRRRAAAHG